MTGRATYDVIVVGAGPAGASAAYWLGEAGKRVLVVEREAVPRYKPCGGAVPKAAFSRFPFSFSSVIEREIGHVRFRFRDGREVAMDLPDRPIAMVMRDRFDAHLLEQARADVREGCHVVDVSQDEEGVDVVTRAGQSFRGSYLIAADGANSRVARAVGLRRRKYVGGSIEVEVPANGELLQPWEETALFLFGSPSKGYQWVFPKATHLSAGIGAFASPGASLRDTLRRDMAKLGIHIDDGEQHGHPLPVYTEHERLHRGRVLLAGDAAALMDPLLGEGIRHAVDSGKLAADAVLADDVPGYSGRVHRQIGDDLLWGIRWARLFYAFPEASYERGVRSPLFIKEFVRILTGQTTYRRMALHAIPLTICGLGRRLPTA